MSHGPNFLPPFNRLPWLSDIRSYVAARPSNSEIRQHELGAVRAAYVHQRRREEFDRQAFKETGSTRAEEGRIYGGFHVSNEK